MEPVLALAYSSNDHSPKLTLNDLNQCLITDETQVQEVEPVIYIGGSVFAVKSDFSVVTGLPKAGKSAVSVFMIATALVDPVPEELDTLQIRATFCEGREVIYIDTEQPKAYTKRLQDTVKKLIRRDRSPPNLRIYNLRPYDYTQRKEAMLLLMDKYPNAHLWIIDGIADLVSDSNEPKECFGIVNELMMKSEKLNTAIVVYLHENPGTQKMRGHLGSELERKCGGAITIKKDRQKGVHTIEPRLIRGSADFECICFRYSQELGRMVSLNKAEVDRYSQEKTQEREGIKLHKLQELAGVCLVQGTVQHSHEMTVKQIITHSLRVEGRMVSRSTAKSRLKSMLEHELVCKDGQGKYALNHKDNTVKSK